MLSVTQQRIYWRSLYLAKIKRSLATAKKRASNIALSNDAIGISIC